ncbi:MULTISPECIES: DUF995 domain-containing protein [unclassified Mesorhizobium]|uniref:DUF995 domain-containing protein n=1 Tax=unclassified Mesorhizobium TaxID=325217 RepID=UPI003014918A
MATFFRSNSATKALRARRCLAIGSAVVSLLAFADAAQAADSEASVPPHDAQVMTSAELYMLYRNKSWQWSDGAGRMQSDGRRFTAWAGSGDKATWAEGRWTLSDNGQLCFKAQWHSLSGASPATTCFGHKRVGGTIYQRREPGQAWYVFKHSTPAQDDEFNKLVRGDLVSSKLQKIRPAIKPEKPRLEANINWSIQP